MNNNGNHIIFYLLIIIITIKNIKQRLRETKQSLYAQLLLVIFHYIWYIAQKQMQYHLKARTFPETAVNSKCWLYREWMRITLKGTWYNGRNTDFHLMSGRINT